MALQYVEIESVGTEAHPAALRFTYKGTTILGEPFYIQEVVLQPADIETIVASYLAPNATEWGIFDDTAK
jgi:hypothetical protein